MKSNIMSTAFQVWWGDASPASLPCVRTWPTSTSDKKKKIPGAQRKGFEMNSFKNIKKLKLRIAMTCSWAWAMKF